MSRLGQWIVAFAMGVALAVFVVVVALGYVQVAHETSPAGTEGSSSVRGRTPRVEVCALSTTQDDVGYRLTIDGQSRTFDSLPACH